MRSTTFKNSPTRYFAARQQWAHSCWNQTKREKRRQMFSYRLTMPLNMPLLPTRPNNTDGPFTHMKATLTTETTWPVARPTYVMRTTVYILLLPIRSLAVICSPPPTVSEYVDSLTLVPSSWRSTRLKLSRTTVHHIQYYPCSWNDYHYTIKGALWNGIVAHHHTIHKKCPKLGQCFSSEKTETIIQNK